MPISKPLPFARYAVAVVAVTGAAAIRLALDPILSGTAPFILFTLAVMVAARYGGRGPGLAAMVASAVVGWHVSLEPRFSFAIANPGGVLDLILFVVAGVGISLLSGQLHRSLVSAAEGEASFRRLSEVVPQLIWTCEPDGGCDYLNPQWTEYTGVPTNEQFGDRWSEQVHPDDRAGLLESWNAAVRAGSEYRAEYRLRRHDGVYRWFDARGVAFRNAEGSIVKWFGSSTDVDDARHLRDALNLERDRLAKIIATAPAAFYSFRLGPDGAVSMPYASPAFADIYGVEPADLARDATPVFSFMHPDDAGHVHASITESAATMKPWHDEFRVRSPRQGEIWIEGRSVPTREPDGGTLWYGFAAVVTERKRAEQALREAEDRFQVALDASRTGYWDMDLSTFAIRGSRQHGRILGFDGPAPDWSLEKFMAAVVPEDRARVVPPPPNGPADLDFECRIERADGTKRWISVRGSWVPDLKGRPGRTMGIIQDITDRKRTEEALRRQTEHEVQVLRTLVAEAPVGLVMLDREMRHIAASERWIADVGLTRDAVIGKRHYEVLPKLPAEWREAHRRGLAGETVSAAGERFVHPDGSEHWVNWEVHPWGDDGVATGGIIIFSEDITERKLVADAARRSELQYRGLFENMSEGLCYCRMIFENGEARDFVYLAVNRAFENLTGLKDVIGKRASEVMPGIRETDPELFKTHGRVALTGVPEKFEIYVHALDTWCSASLYSPEREYFVSVFDVITERKREQQELADSRTRLQLALDVAELGVMEYDPATCALTASPRWSAIFGFDRTPTEPETYARVHPEDRRRVIPLPQRLPSGRESWETEYRIAWPSGEVRWVVSRGAVNRTGERPRLIVVMKDITPEKEAEQALRRSEALYRAIASGIPGSGVWVVDAGLRCLAAEGELVSQLGMDSARLVGYEEFNRRALAGESVSYEIEYQDRILSMQHVPLRDEAGKVVAAMALALDITSRKRAEAEILELNAELEKRVQDRTTQLAASNKELEAFAYSVSHDLRAPLRGIDGWSLALMEDYGSGLDEQARRYLGRVRSETQRMGLLIDDLLQLSRVTRARLTIESVDLTLLAQTIAARLKEANPGRRFDFSIEPGLVASGDARLLEIVLTNLLDNAVKFTAPRDRANIEFGRILHDGEPAFFVRDNGVGFDMTYAGALFGAFQRMHSMSEFPGSGIGLATVQRVVHRHGGRVWAEAEVDRGATLYFTIGAAT